jgi:hypothetical protein
MHLRRSLATVSVKPDLLKKQSENGYVVSDQVLSWTSIASIYVETGVNMAEVLKMATPGEEKRMFTKVETK